MHLLENIKVIAIFVLNCLSMLLSSEKLLHFIRFICFDELANCLRVSLNVIFSQTENPSQILQVCVSVLSWNIKTVHIVFSYRELHNFSVHRQGTNRAIHPVNIPCARRN